MEHPRWLFHSQYGALAGFLENGVMLELNFKGQGEGGEENMIYGRLRNSIQYDIFRELQVGQRFESAGRREAEKRVCGLL